MLSLPQNEKYISWISLSLILFICVLLNSIYEPQVCIVRATVGIEGGTNTYYYILLLFDVIWCQLMDKFPVDHKIFESSANPSTLALPGRWPNFGHSDRWARCGIGPRVASCESAGWKPNTRHLQKLRNGEPMWSNPVPWEVFHFWQGRTSLLRSQTTSLLVHPLPAFGDSM